MQSLPVDGCGDGNSNDIGTGNGNEIVEDMDNGSGSPYKQHQQGISDGCQYGDRQDRTAVFFFAGRDSRVATTVNFSLRS